jgi:hypothetical protein
LSDNIYNKFSFAYVLLTVAFFSKYSKYKTW